jgi:hypothetical protein
MERAKEGRNTGHGVNEREESERVNRQGERVNRQGERVKRQGERGKGEKDAKKKKDINSIG